MRVPYPYNYTPRNKYMPIIIVIAVIVIGYLAYRFLMPHGGMEHGMGGASPVSVATVIERKAQEWNEFSGKLVAVDNVEIRPRVSGIIESVHFKDSTMVKRGELLFVIDTKPYEADMSRAEAALSSAQAQAALADSELARAQRLYKEKAIPQREYDERKNTANVARANLESAQASYETARLNLDYTQVTSPIDGKVGRAEITVGNLVEAGPNAPVLTTVVSNNPIYMDFEVDEDTFLQYIDDSNTIQKEETSQIPVIMTVGNENTMSYKGYVQSFDNSLNISSGTIRTRAVFANDDGRLVPGLFARIKIGNPEEKQTVLITDRAVGTDQNKKFVYVIDAENKAVYREVKLGSITEGLRIVKEGLASGEKIVVNGLQRVRPGQPVTPEMVSMETGEALNAQPAATTMTESAQ